MDGHFTFGGLKSSDYNVWIKGGGTYGAASRRFTTEIVPGRNGELTIDDGVFEEKEHPYEAFIGENFPSNIDGFRNELMSLTGRQILMDTYHPDEFYLARYMRGLEPDVLTLARAGSFTVTFSRDPRRFLVAGNAPTDVPASSESTPFVMYNPTRFASYPLLRVYGTGVLYIAGISITVTGSLAYIDIDTEIGDCYYGSTNANQYVTFTGNDFPKLQPGANTMYHTGFTTVEITPRWWKL